MITICISDRVVERVKREREKFQDKTASFLRAGNVTYGRKIRENDARKVFDHMVSPRFTLHGIPSYPAVRPTESDNLIYLYFSYYSCKYEREHVFER